MKLYSLNELSALSQDQLFDLHREMSRYLMVLSADAIERREAFENLDTIRRILNRPSRPLVYTPRRGRFLPPAP
jgi:hypothetical protein